MTREQQRQIKEAKQAAKIALRIERKEAQKEARNWQKFVIRMKMLGAWIEDNETQLINQ